MKLNRLFIDLMTDHTHMSSDDIAEYQTDINREYDGIESSALIEKRIAAGETGLKVTWKNKAKTFFENPYIRTFLVIIYWWLHRKIGDWKNGISRSDSRDDDDRYDDDDDDFDSVSEDRISSMLDKKLRDMRLNDRPRKPN